MTDTHSVTIEIPADADSDHAGETVHLEVPGTEYLLAAARAAGYWLPADCQVGWCTSCAARLVSGEVDQSHARRYYEIDAEADFVLLCTAKPRSDLELVAHQQDELLDLRAEHDLPPGTQKR